MDVIRGKGGKMAGATRGLDTNLFTVCVEKCAEVTDVWMLNESHNLEFAVLDIQRIHQ